MPDQAVISRPKAIRPASRDVDSRRRTDHGLAEVDRRPFSLRVAATGFVIVSIDYRLAPETKLPAIIEDVQDAWRWLRQEGPKRFGIDPERMAAAGGSAGGYLTLMTGFCLKPRPRALVSLLRLR